MTGFRVRASGEAGVAMGGIGNRSVWERGEETDYWERGRGLRVHSDGLNSERIPECGGRWCGNLGVAKEGEWLVEWSGMG